MPTTTFDMDRMASWYARAHFKTNPGIRSIYYLPKHAPDGEIRLVEINVLVADRGDGSLEPVDFGVDTVMDCEHKLLVLDITPSQWDRISHAALSLPLG